LAQRASLDQLHGNEHEIAMQADIMDGDDIGMRQPRHRLRFTHQAVAQLSRLWIDVGAQQLDGDLAAELRIARGVDHPHGAGADEPA
jgi:hypothetical protein